MGKGKYEVRILIWTVPEQINFQRIQDLEKLQERGAGAQDMPYVKATLPLNEVGKFLLLISTVGIEFSLACN